MGAIIYPGLAVNEISVSKQITAITDDQRLEDIRFQDDPSAPLIVEVDEAAELIAEINQLSMAGFDEIDVNDLAGYKRGRHDDDEGEGPTTAPNPANESKAERLHHARRESINTARREAIDNARCEARVTRDLPPCRTQEPPPSTKKSRKNKPLKPINALFGQPPLNILEILSKVMIEIPITWIMQFSPYFRDETKRLFSSPRLRRSKKQKDKDGALYDTGAYEEARELKRAAEAYREAMLLRASTKPTTTKAPPSPPPPAKDAPIFPQSVRVAMPQLALVEYMQDEEMLSAQVDHIDSTTTTVDVDRLSTEILADISRWNKRDTSYRSFGVPATITNTHTIKQAILPRNQVIVDSGADISLMYPHLRIALGLKPYEASSHFPAMAMSNADGTKCELTHFVVFDVHVKGVKRSTWAFVSPTEKTDQKLSLILGVPTLNSMNVVIHFGNGTVQLGDADRNEDIIVLHPPLSASVAPEITMRVDTVRELFGEDDEDESDSEEDSDEEEGDSDSNDEDDNDEQGFR
ncbi:hypothetical protein TI39_contig4182g00001 [Zymoseptoria brevis]|uniref:Uncharacterized protein n=1 Tax=Zymoseptoria brevis TaxID=1047168 RepID=A0A0F4GAW0_9PEZI|nr:hypothetical protein TI39_contig4182g00001 [Zymoseptoria brevis]